MTKSKVRNDAADGQTAKPDHGPKNSDENQTPYDDGVVKNLRQLGQKILKEPVPERLLDILRKPRS